MKKILIVDDIKENLSLLETILKNTGYKTVSALNGAEAIERLQGDEGFDMIISDILMPVMDGFQLCKHVKGNEKLKHIPFIFYTATYTDEKDEELALKMGVDKFIRKPMEIDKFISIVLETIKSFGDGTLKVKKLTMEEDEEIFKLYNERLIKKLEHKVSELEEEIIRRKETEETLRESEEKFQAISNTANDAIIMVDNDGKISYWNKAAENIFEYTSEEAVGKNLHELDAPANLQEILLKGFKEFKETGMEHFVGKLNELTAIKKDGTEFPIEYFVTAVRLKGKWNAVYIIRDITERKLSEKTITHLASFPQLNLNPIIEINGAGSITFHNDAVTKVLNEMGANDDVSILLPEDINEIIKDLKNKESLQLYREVQVGNSMFAENIYLMPVLNVVRIYATDITGRKLAQDKLQESEEQFRCTFDQAGVGIAHVAANGRFLKTNKLFCDILGHAEEELRNLTLQDITHYDELQADTNLANRKLDDTFKTYAIEKRYLKKDGTIVWVNLTVSLVRKPDGELKYFICVVEDITERKQIEDALRKSEEKFRAIFDNTFQFIGLLNPDGAVIEVNRGALDFVGIKLADIFNKPLWETPWWSHSPALQSLLQKSIHKAAKGNFIRFEAEHFKHDGTLAYIDTSLTPVKDKNGNVIFIIPEGRDITELKQIEEKVHMLSQAVEQSPAAVIITDKDGKIEYVNKTFSKISGYDYSEVIGKNPRILKSGEKSPEEYRELWKAITSGYEWRGEFHNKKKNGALYWEFASISPITSQEGDITHFLAVKEDITERKLTEQALQDSEERFRTISETANDGIIMVDNNGKISYWNKAAENMFEYTSEEAVGKNLHELVVPSNLQERLLKGFKEFRDTGHGPFVGKTVELVAIKKDGTKFPIEHSISAVKLKGKWNAVGVIRDISERKYAEETLRISYKMASLGRLTAGVFHEVLNPVNIIASHVQLLLMEAEEGSKTEEDLKSIQEEIKRIVKISDSLLRFARKGELIAEEVDVNSLLERVLSIVEPDMKLENVRFIRRLEEKLPKITANGDELRQVFLNLITNARDAMPDGGTLTVITRVVRSSELRVQSRQAGVHKGDFVEISFEDTGGGIRKENLDKLFDPFFTTKKEGEGTGLGLSTSYSIIENHDGILSVESEVGKGTTFTIDLPVEDL